MRPRNPRVAQITAAALHSFKNNQIAAGNSTERGIAGFLGTRGMALK